MFQETGNIRIFPDYESRKLRVQTNSMPAHLMPYWNEIEGFTDPQSWADSPYPKQVTDEDLQDSIIWFWLDIYAPPRKS